MKKDYAHIIMVLDASGSMAGLTQDTIGSFNSFIKEQRLLPGKATVSVYTFNSNVKLVKDFVDIQEIQDLATEDYIAQGYTALLDAQGHAINEVGDKLKKLPESQRPDRVLMLTISDGFENASKEFNAEKIKKMIKHQEEVYSWKMLYLGANQDAFSVSANMGYSINNTSNYHATSHGVGQTMNLISSNVSLYRSMSTADAASSKFFSKEDQDKLEKAK